VLKNVSGNAAETGGEIDSYRDRVGALVRDGRLLAYLRVAVEDPSPPPRRRLWRSVTVSAPAVTVHVRFVDDADLHTTTPSTEELASHLRRWNRQQHVVYGDVYELDWLDEPAAGRVTNRFFVPA